ncbi:MAG: energy-coupling factor transporter transmembrane protein EcfT [Coriobacteriales bacterium]|jgi:energy-coupling factor transport system permease protein|nr:energy-coupling factor transporter transmembrane protein EcfT [Coriobacteriales bacterium]
METLQVSRPLYPLLCIAFSMFTLVGGLLLARDLLLAALLVALGLIYLGFGYGKVLLRCLALGLVLAAVIGSLSWLVSGSGPKALQMAGRLLLVTLCAVPVISLSPVALTRSLAQLGCPRILTLGMLVAIRFVPILLGEMHRVREAMRTRGVRLLSPAYFYRAFLIPLIMRLVSISELLALSLETRGFDLSQAEATVFRPVRFGARDWAFAVVTLLLLAAMLWGILFGASLVETDVVF